MSGGSLDYAYNRVNDMAYELARHAKTRHQKALVSHLVKVSKALHDVEWVLSGDYGDGDDTAAIMDCIGKKGLLESDLIRAEEVLKDLTETIGELS